MWDIKERDEDWVGWREGAWGAPRGWEEGGRLGRWCLWKKGWRFEEESDE